MEFDVTIVGAGLYGSTMANRLSRAGLSCVVIEKRSNVGGNCFTHVHANGTVIHDHGAHIFHTNDTEVWEFVNRIHTWRMFNHRVKSVISDRGVNSIYSAPPISLSTMHQVFGASSPETADSLLASLRRSIGLSLDEATNFEDYMLARVGRHLYELFFEGYTTKQWGISPRNVPASVAKRIPVRMTWDDSYFSDRYQAMPVGGYTPFITKLLGEVPVWSCYNYKLAPKSNVVVYTGKLDEFFDYQFGRLSYRSLKFTTSDDTSDIQGTAVVNYPDLNVPWTRIVEHRHFEPWNPVNGTVITKEVPVAHTESNDPYYPCHFRSDYDKLTKYMGLASRTKNVVFGGRLATYRYIDMHQTIRNAMDDSAKIIKDFGRDVVN